MPIIDHDSNRWLEEAPELLVLPDAKDIRREQHDPDYYLRRLEEMGSPKERLAQLIKSVFNINAEPTHEAHFIRMMAAEGALAGFVLGAVLKSRDIQESYIRQHNAEIFTDKYRANRHFWDTLITGTVGRGLGYAVKCSLLASAAGMIGMGSVTYRNDLYLPDWLIGIGALGALSRLWLGSRAVAAGALFGTAAGALGFGLGKLFEVSTGYPITQWRYIEHKHWQDRNTARTRFLQRLAEEDHKEYLDKIMKDEA